MDLKNLDLLTQQELLDLSQETAEIAVSLFLPTTQVEADVEQNPIRFKNMIREADQQMEQHGTRQDTRAAILEPLRALLEDDMFWLHQSNGLAVFATAETMKMYRLPLDFKEFAAVGTRFHIKPLLPLFSSEGRYYLLALSKNAVRLFMGSRYSLNELPLSATPTSIDEALWYDDPEKSLQHHTQKERTAGRDEVMYHGQGVGSDDAKARANDRTVRFFQQVSDGLMEDHLRDQRAPLVVAGVEYYLPIFIDACNYKNIVSDSVVAGNPDRKNTTTLHEESWAIVESIFEQHVQAERDKYTEGKARDLLTCEGVKSVIPAAYFKQIETLFVADNVHVWGQFDPDTNTLTLNDEARPGDEDLLDLAAVHTLQGGGRVFIVPDEHVISSAPAAALLRYSADVDATIA